MNIDFTWVGGATWVLRIDSSVKIACDPVLCTKGHVQDYRIFTSARLNDPIFRDEDFNNVNLWLLTHNHEDHLDSAGMKRIQKNSTIIAHSCLNNAFNKNIYPDFNILNWGSNRTITFSDTTITITAVPAIHSKRRFLRSIVGNGNGYLVQIVKESEIFTVYITGDSIYCQKDTALLKEINIDLIIANVGSAMVDNSFLSSLIGRITNNCKDVLNMYYDLKPKHLVPVHWGTFSHYKELITVNSFTGCKNVKIINPGESLTFEL